MSFQKHFTPPTEANPSTTVLARPTWIGPFSEGMAVYQLAAVSPGNSVVEFMTCEPVPSATMVNVGDVPDAVRWAEALGWEGRHDDDPRGGIIGFDGVVRLTVTDDGRVEVTIIGEDDELAPSEFANLFASSWEPPENSKQRVDDALELIRMLSREGHEPNLRRQLAWIGFRDDEVIAIQAIGPGRKDPNYLALARSRDDAVSLSKLSALSAPNRWGKQEPIPHQGIYLVPNRLVGRIDELFSPSHWAVMPEGVITDARVVSRRCFYLDLDTQRRDERGNRIDLPIAATRGELHLTVGRSLLITDDILAALGAIGIDRPQDVLASMMSGNGVQIWFALADISETPDLHALVRELLAIWGTLFDGDVSHVDTGVYDAKRIGPLAGTVKRKGVRKELHRLVTFDGAVSPRRLTLAELQRLARHYRGKLTPDQRAAVAKTLGVRPPLKAQPTSTPRGGGLTACNAISIRDVAAKLGLDPEAPVCPGCGSGGGSSDVAFLDSNLLNCKHNRCSSRPNRTAVDLVAKVALDCDNIVGTTGIARQVLAWFRTNFNVGDRR